MSVQLCESANLLLPWLNGGNAAKKLKSVFDANSIIGCVDGGKKFDTVGGFENLDESSNETAKSRCPFTLFGTAIKLLKISFFINKFPMSYHWALNTFVLSASNSNLLRHHWNKEIKYIFGKYTRQSCSSIFA